MQTTHPSKEQVRIYMQWRKGSRLPPPEMKETRRQLGWELIPGNQR